MAIVYGLPPSPYVRKVMLAHAFKNVSYELAPTFPGSEDASFREASPLGKIPAYRVNDSFGFSDSAVITAYLERAHPENALYPVDANDYAQALWLEKYNDTKLSEVTAALYFQRVVGPAFFEHTTEEERVSDLITNLIPAQLTYLEQTLANNTYFVGNTFTIADLVIGASLMSLEHADFTIDKATWPALAKFATAFFNRAEVVTQFNTEKSLINK